MFFITFRHFFEMVRFDFVFDDKLNVYLMEVREFWSCFFWNLCSVTVAILHLKFVVFNCSVVKDLYNVLWITVSCTFLAVFHVTNRFWKNTSCACVKDGYFQSLHLRDRQPSFMHSAGASCMRWPVCLTCARFGRERTSNQTWFQ